MGLLTLGLAFEHESGIFLVPSLFAASVLPLLLREESKASRRARIIWAAVFVALGFWLLNRIFGPTAGNSQYFRGELRQSWDPFRQSCAIEILGTCASLLLVRYGRKVSGFVLLAITIVASLWAFGRSIGERESTAFWASSRARTVACAWVSLIGFAFLAYLKAGKVPVRVWRPAWIVAVLALGLAFLHDWTLTDSWSRSMTNLERRLASGPSCQVLDDDTAYTELVSHGFDLQTLPEISLILAESEAGRVERIVLTTDTNLSRKDRTPPCDWIAQKRLPYYDILLRYDSYWAFQLPTLPSRAPTQN